MHLPTCPRRYDFGYLLKILTCLPLPATEAEFFELLNLYFPNIFDIKCVGGWGCLPRGG